MIAWASGTLAILAIIIALPSGQCRVPQQKADGSIASPNVYKERVRWYTLKCWRLPNSVPCDRHADCERPCRAMFANKHRSYCVGAPGVKHCVLDASSFVPYWLIDRDDNLDCCTSGQVFNLVGRTLADAAV